MEKLDELEAQLAELRGLTPPPVARRTLEDVTGLRTCPEDLVAALPHRHAVRVLPDFGAFGVVALVCVCGAKVEVPAGQLPVTREHWHELVLTCRLSREPKEQAQLPPMPAAGEPNVSPALESST